MQKNSANKQQRTHRLLRSILFFFRPCVLRVRVHANLQKYAYPKPHASKAITLHTKKQPIALPKSTQGSVNPTIKPLGFRVYTRKAPKAEKVLRVPRSPHQRAPRPQREVAKDHRSCNLALRAFWTGIYPEP